MGAQSAVFTLSLMFIAYSSATIIHSKCPKLSAQNNFQLHRYLGRWFEYQRFSAWFETGVVCGSANYSINDDGSIKVVNAGRQEIDLFGIQVVNRPVSVTGRATVFNLSRPAELTVSFSPFDTGTGPANYFVLETDYTGYSAVFSCTPLLGPFSLQYAWIMTRERGVSPTDLDAIRARLQATGLSVDSFNMVSQTDCHGY